MNFLKAIKDHKTDVILVFSLFVIFFLFLSRFWAHLGHPIIDCGREAYVPMEILKGKVLFKDILILYGPLSYQLNALLFFFLGQNLSILYLAGTINSLIILLSIYLISRSLTSKAVAFTISFLVMTTCVFSAWIFNFIFPYSYAATYALSSFLLSVLFCIYYLKTNKLAYILLSFFFIGISLVTKLEYSFFLTILFSIIFFFKPLTVKHSVFCLSTLISIPIISWLVLFSQGLTLTNVINYINFGRSFFNSKNLAYFYENYTGLYPSREIFFISFKSFIDFIIHFSIITGIFYLYFFISQKIKQYKFSLILQFFLITLLIVTFPLKFISKIANTGTFSWISLTTVLILIVLIFNYFKFNQQNTKYKVLIFLLFSGICMLFRSFFYINLQVYGTFYIPLVLLINIIFLVDIFPDFLKFLNKDIWKKACCSTFIILGLIFSLKYLNIIGENNNYPISTSKGTLYSREDISYALTKTLAYIQNNMSDNDSFLMLPEGPILNFLSDRESDDWYYSLIPNHIEALGERNIINKLQKKPPNYIFINNRNSADYGVPYFCTDYGFGICKFIQNNYKLQTKIGSEFKILIYKRNNK